MHERPEMQGGGTLAGIRASYPPSSDERNMLEELLQNLETEASAEYQSKEATKKTDHSDELSFENIINQLPDLPKEYATLLSDQYSLNRHPRSMDQLNEGILDFTHRACVFDIGRGSERKSMDECGVPKSEHLQGQGIVQARLHNHQNQGSHVRNINPSQLLPQMAQKQIKKHDVMQVQNLPAQAKSHDFAGKPKEHGPITQVICHSISQGNIVPFGRRAESPAKFPKNTVVGGLPQSVSSHPGSDSSMSNDQERDSGSRKAKSSRAKDITLDQLKDLYHLPGREAAKMLCVSSNLLKRLLRKYGIERWPQRKLLSLKNLKAAFEDDMNVSEADRQAIFARIDANLEAVIQNPNHKVQDDLLELRQVNYKQVYYGKRTDKGDNSEHRQRRPSRSLASAVAKSRFVSEPKQLTPGGPMKHSGSQMHNEDTINTGPMQVNRHPVAELITTSRPLGNRTGASVPTSTGAPNHNNMVILNNRGHPLLPVENSVAHLSAPDQSVKRHYGEPSIFSSALDQLNSSLYGQYTTGIYGNAAGQGSSQIAQVSPLMCGRQIIGTGSKQQYMGQVSNSGQFMEVQAGPVNAHPMTAPQYGMIFDTGQSNTATQGLSQGPQQVQVLDMNSLTTLQSVSPLEVPQRGIMLQHGSYLNPQDASALLEHMNVRHGSLPVMLPNNLSNTVIACRTFGQPGMLIDSSQILQPQLVRAVPRVTILPQQPMLPSGQSPLPMLLSQHLVPEQPMAQHQQLPPES